MVVFVNKRLGVQKEKATFSSKERKAQLISQPVYKQQEKGEWALNYLWIMWNIHTH